MNFAAGQRLPSWPIDTVSRDTSRPRRSRLKEPEMSFWQNFGLTIVALGLGLASLLVLITAGAAMVFVVLKALGN
jgi:hypothetical protein